MVERGEEFRERERAGLQPDEVRALSRLSPLRSTLSLVHTWGLVAGLVVVAHRWPNPLVVALAIVGIAAQQHALAILAHQSAHYRLYENRRLNDLVGRLCALPLGVSMVTYRVIHRIHHNNLYSPIDPDLPLMAGYPRGRAYLAFKLLKDLVGLTTFKNYLYFIGRPSGVTSPLDDTSSRLRAAARRDRAWVVGFAVLVATVVGLTGTWRWFLLLWFLPLVTLLQAILRLRAVCEHGAVRDTHSPLFAARTTLAPWWVRWLVFPHNMHFHIEHHLYPSVPHYRLAECHRRLASTVDLREAELVPSFYETLRRIFDAPRLSKAE
jgi:fatty acid desaturase